MTGFIDEEFDSKFDIGIFTEYYHNIDEANLIGAKSVSMVISENAIKRLKTHNPACKIILVLRDPVKRAYSAYWYCRRMGWETAQTFDAAIDKKKKIILWPYKKKL